MSAPEMEPRYTARLTSGGGQTFRTLDSAKEKHAQNIRTYGKPGEPIPTRHSLELGEMHDPGEAPPRVYADGVYLHYVTKPQRINAEEYK